MEMGVSEELSQEHDGTHLKRHVIYQNITIRSDKRDILKPEKNN